MKKRKEYKEYEVEDLNPIENDIFIEITEEHPEVFIQLLTSEFNLNDFIYENFGDEIIQDDVDENAVLFCSKEEFINEFINGFSSVVGDDFDVESDINSTTPMCTPWVWMLDSEFERLEEILSEDSSYDAGVMWGKECLDKNLIKR